VRPVLLEDVAAQLVAHRARPEDQHVFVVRQARGDLLDEAGEVFEPVRLAGGLGDPAAAVTDGGVVTHVTGAPASVRHL
jgi:hypothetical protein